MSADGQQTKESRDPALGHPGAGNHVLRAEAKPFVPVFSALRPPLSVVVGLPSAAQQPSQPQPHRHHEYHRHHHPHHTSVQVGTTNQPKFSVSPAHYDEDGKLMYRARLSFHQDPAAQRNLAEKEYLLGYRSSTRKSAGSLPLEAASVYVDGGGYAMFNVDTNEPMSVSAALRAEANKRSSLARRTPADGPPPSRGARRGAACLSGSASTGMMYNPFVDPMALRTEEAVAKLLDDTNDLGCEGLLEAVRRIELERSDQPAGADGDNSAFGLDAPAGALLKVPVAQPQLLLADVGAASGTQDVEPIGPTARTRQHATTSPTAATGSPSSAAAGSVLAQHPSTSPVPVPVVRVVPGMKHPSPHFHQQMQPSISIGTSAAAAWMRGGAPPPLPQPSRHSHAVPPDHLNRRPPPPPSPPSRHAQVPWSVPHADPGASDASATEAHPPIGSLRATGDNSSASLNTTAANSSVGPHDHSDDMTVHGIASFSVSEPLVPEALKVNAETFFAAAPLAQQSAMGSGTRNPFSLQSLQGVRRTEASIPLQKVLWQRVFFRDAETWVPPPFDPIPDELVRLYNGAKHYDVSRPASHPHVALHLYQYRCNACTIDVYPGKVNERPADIKLGGICGDVPALCVAHLVEVITGVKIQAIDMFGNNLGRCNLWLQNPSQVPELTSKFDRKMWMSPVVHGYAVVVSNDEGREYLLWYLEGLRAHGPKSVRFPRHLVTCEKWLA